MSAGGKDAEPRPARNPGASRGRQHHFVPIYSDSIILDTKAPKGTVLINGGGQYHHESGGEALLLRKRGHVHEAEPRRGSDRRGLALCNEQEGDASRRERDQDRAGVFQGPERKRVASSGREASLFFSSHIGLMKKSD